MSSPIYLHVLKPGLHSSIQDGGRTGYQHLGVPVGGPLDRKAARIANDLVGNPPLHPVIESTLIGPHLVFDHAVQIALTGAAMSPALDGQPVPCYQTIAVQAGQTLTFGKLQSGCRAYLAIRGDWQVASWLQSVSYFPDGAQQCTPQSLLFKGQILEIHPLPPIMPRTYRLPVSLDRNPITDIRVLPGPEFDQFPSPAIASFYGCTHRIASDSNRMGYRLERTLEAFQPQGALISSGILPGTIQVPASGKPIVLLADAQTTGGYLRLAVVIQADLDRFGQLKPGDTLRFMHVTLEEARKAHLEYVNSGSLYQ